MSCPREMEQARPRSVPRGVVGWEGPVPGLDPVEIVSALVAAPGFPIKRGLPATTLTALSVAQI